MIRSSKETSRHCDSSKSELCRVVLSYIDVSIPQHFVEHVAELPAENGAAGQREAQSVGPEGVSSFLPVSSQDDSWS